jgi:acyl-CoA thioesterase
MVMMTGEPETNTDAKIGGPVAEFNQSEFARLLGMHISEARDGYAKVGMDCTGKCNPHGFVHGGAIFSLADQAFAIASNCSGISHVAVSVHIQYIAPAKGPLVAIAERVADNGTCDIVRVTVYEGLRTIAVFDGVAFCNPPQQHS